jgi:5'-3' exonuclease
MEVHLIDGTYELFRYYHAVPSARDAQGIEVGAVRGVLGSVLGMINHGVTHLGVATDHVIESFRNRLWPGYKTSAGVPTDLLSQFLLLEEALTAMGVVVWPMIEYEADDALAAAAAAAAREPQVDRVIICTPDKDLAQCVRGTRVVQLNRRTNVIRDEPGVVAKFGVPPASNPDYLALVRARAFRAPRVDPSRREGLACDCVECRNTRRNAPTQPRARVSIPRSRDAANGHPHFSLHRRAAMERAHS